MVKLNGHAQQMTATVCYPPTTGARDLRDQLADMQTFEQSPHRRTGTSVLSAHSRVAEQRSPDVAVTKTSADMVAVQDCSKQL
jgi:hypothetical protein